MIKHIWSVICTKSTTDKDSNNISLIETLEQINFTIGANDIERFKNSSEEKKIFPVSFELVSLFYRDSEKEDAPAEIKFGIVDPEGKTVGGHEYQLRFDDGKRRMRVNVKINGIPVTKPGVYMVPVMMKEKGKTEYKIVSEIPIEVNVAYSP